MEEENRAQEEDKNEPEDGKMKAKEEEVEKGREIRKEDMKTQLAGKQRNGDCSGKGGTSV